mmetsp:Transcript_74106/g.167913  ORF Transcript_74106/g.167913 Transcript_74106/m.167913 type:complete len:285 (-) Transcript_74106:113-967(-)
MALRTAGTSQPTGHEPAYQSHQQQIQQAGSSSSSMSAIAQLFARLSQEIEEHKPKNCIHFMVDFLCRHYPEHLHGFASIWQMDPDLERERHEVVNFFKAHKISTAVAAHFTNAGYDTLDTLTTLSPESLLDVEAFNNVKWLPGHKVRLQQIFGEISARVRAYRQQLGTTGAQQYGSSAAPYGAPRAQHGLAERYTRPSSPFGGTGTCAGHGSPGAQRPLVKPAALLSAAPASYSLAAHHSLAPHGITHASAYTPSLVAPSALGAGMPSLSAPAPLSYANQYAFP